MTNRQLNFENIDKVENLNYTPLEKKYLKVQTVKTILVYIIFMGLTLLFLLAEEFAYRVVTTIGIECVFLTAMIVNLFLLPKAYSYKGFAIREHDITYRSGIIFPSVITIPFCKIQQVSIRQNPITRIFGLHTIDIVNGAQMLEATSIPGLTEEKANDIKALIIESIRNENK